MNKGIFLSLPVEIVQQIQERCEADGIPEAQRGRSGGPTEWIRRLVYRELGLDGPVDPHEEQSKLLKGKARVRRP